MSEEKLEDWQVAFSMAAQAMHNHGIPISCPWEGDLDDEEAERYNGLVAAIDSYLTVFPPTGREDRELRNLVAVLLANNPNEQIADNGMTVYDAFKDEAIKLLGKK